MTFPPADPETRDGAPVSVTRIRARSYELDSLGHVNHAVFLNWFEEARFAALEASGFTIPELERRGWSIVVARIEVDYRKEVLMGDELDIRTWMSGRKKTSMILSQEATRGDEVVAEARVVGVWLDGGRPTRIPDEVLETLGPGTP